MMARQIKQVHPDNVICYKVGNFYNCYGKDAYIMSYLFKYKIKTIEEDIAVLGFPKNALLKVQAVLERKKLNYMLIDTRNNYYVDEEENFGNLNKYEEIFSKAHSSLKLQRRIDKICETLKQEQNIDKIRKIEEIVYEIGKI